MKRARIKIESSDNFPTLFKREKPAKKVDFLEIKDPENSKKVIMTIKSPKVPIKSIGADFKPIRLNEVLESFNSKSVDFGIKESIEFGK